MLNLGWLLEARGRTDEAETAYRDAIATNEPFVAPKARLALDRFLDRRCQDGDAE
jgi:hypothetical protein